VEISCTDFQTVADAGGSCPEDTTNIVTLFKELRAALGKGARITVASQASKPLEIEMAVAQLDPYVDAFHLMTYDYTVSDIVASDAVLAPNAPLYTPANASVTQMSVDYTNHNYLNATVAPSKIMLGISSWRVQGVGGLRRAGVRAGRVLRPVRRHQRRQARRRLLPLRHVHVQRDRGCRRAAADV
jgi:hypothetical protein